jgi:hypothetical protein
MSPDSAENDCCGIFEPPLLPEPLWSDIKSVTSKAQLSGSARKVDRCAGCCCTGLLIDASLRAFVSAQADCSRLRSLASDAAPCWRSLQ